MREHVWIIDGHPIAVRLKDGVPQVAHELPDPMRPADEGWHGFGGAHTLEDDLAVEILSLAEENKRLKTEAREAWHCAAQNERNAGEEARLREEAAVARIRRELLEELRPEIRLLRLPGSSTEIECIPDALFRKALDRICPEE